MAITVASVALNYPCNSYWTTQPKKKVAAYHPRGLKPKRYLLSRKFGVQMHDNKFKDPRNQPSLKELSHDGCVAEPGSSAAPNQGPDCPLNTSALDFLPELCPSHRIAQLHLFSSKRKKTPYIYILYPLVIVEREKQEKEDPKPCWEPSRSRFRGCSADCSECPT